MRDSVGRQAVGVRPAKRGRASPSLLEARWLCRSERGQPRLQIGPRSTQSRSVIAKRTLSRTWPVQVIRSRRITPSRTAPNFAIAGCRNVAPISTHWRSGLMFRLDVPTMFPSERSRMAYASHRGVPCPRARTPHRGSDRRQPLCCQRRRRSRRGWACSLCAARHSCPGR